jgi:hypothetical protein
LRRELIVSLADRSHVPQLVVDLLELSLQLRQLRLDVLDGGDMGQEGSARRGSSSGQFTGGIDLVSLESDAHLADGAVEGKLVGHVEVAADEHAAKDELHRGLEILKKSGDKLVQLYDAFKIRNKWIFESQL